MPSSMGSASKARPSICSRAEAFQVCDSQLPILFFSFFCYREIAVQKTASGSGCTQYQEIWIIGVFLETLARLIQREFWDGVLTAQLVEFFPVESHDDRAALRVTCKRLRVRLGRKRNDSNSGRRA